LRKKGNLTSVIPVLVTGIQQRRVCGAKESLHAKDFAWLDSCDKHRNDDGEVRRRDLREEEIPS